MWRWCQPTDCDTGLERKLSKRPSRQEVIDAGVAEESGTPQLFNAHTQYALADIAPEALAPPVVNPLPESIPAESDDEEDEADGQLCDRIVRCSVSDGAPLPMRRQSQLRRESGSTNVLMNRHVMAAVQEARSSLDHVCCIRFCHRLTCQQGRKARRPTAEDFMCVTEEEVAEKEERRSSLER